MTNICMTTNISHYDNISCCFSLRVRGPPSGCSVIFLVLVWINFITQILFQQTDRQKQKQIYVKVEDWQRLYY